MADIAFAQPPRGSGGATAAGGQAGQADQALSRHECLGLLAIAPVGRIIYSRQALPAAEPVDFAVDRDSVVIRVDERSRLAKAVEHAVVAFEADEYDAAAGTGWSVTVVGESSGVAEPAEVKRLSGIIREHWCTDGKDHLVRIGIASVAGRRIVSAA